MANRDLTFRLLGKDVSAGRTLEQVGSKADGLKSRLAGFGGAAVKALGGLTVAAGGAAVAGGMLGIKTAAAAEQAEIAFTTMLGSGEKAKSFLDDLQQFAAKTPFEFPELQTAASSLVSAGIEADKVIPIMTSLGNATSGMGTGSEGVQRATVALQQMSAAGRITGEDLNQLRDAGIPVFDLLAAATGKSKEAVAQLAQSGKLGKKEMGQLFKALETGKGLERFSGLMDKQSRSLTGLWATFQDTLGQGLSRLMMGAVPTLKRGLGAVSTGMQQFFDGITGNVKIMDTSARPKLELFGLGLKGLGDAFKSGDVTSDGFVGAMERVGATAGVIVEKVREVGPKVLRVLGDLAKTVGAAAGPVITAITKGVQGALDAFAPDIKKFATNLAGALAGPNGVIGSVRSAIETGDWAPVGKSIGNALRTALEGAGDLMSAFGKIFAKIDWMSIGIKIGKQAPALLIGLIIGLINFDIGGLLKGLASHWQEAVIAVLFLAFAPAALIGKIASLLARIPFAGRFLVWMLNQAVRISKGLVGIVGKILSGLGRGFIAGFRSVFPTVGRAFSDALSLLPTRLGLLIIRLGEIAKGIPGAILNAIVGGAARVGKAMGWLVGKILTPYVGLGRLLLRAGGTLMRSLWSGISGGFGRLLSVVGEIPRRIGNVFSGAGRWLFDAGKALLRGLIDGIKSMVGAVADTAKDVAGKIGGFFPGSPIKEGPLTSWNRGGAGIRLMEGLAAGINRGAGTVSAAMAGAAGLPDPILPGYQMSGGGAAGYGSGVHVTVDLRGAQINGTKGVNELAATLARPVVDAIRSERRKGSITGNV